MAPRSTVRCRGHFALDLRTLLQNAVLNRTVTRIVRRLVLSPDTVLDTLDIVALSLNIVLDLSNLVVLSPSLVLSPGIVLDTLGILVVVEGG